MGDGKFEPFWSRDFPALVSGLLERKWTDFSISLTSFSFLVAVVVFEAMSLLSFLAHWKNKEEPMQS